MLVPPPAIKALFLDIGGVLLTHSWGPKARHLAAQHFGLDSHQLDKRHRLTFEAYQAGRITLDQYLDRTVFYQLRPFSRCVFKAFMMSQSEPYPQMIRLVEHLKQHYGLKLVALNNEGRELNDFRIRQFGLNNLFDAFVSSCYVHCCKPDVDLFHLALNVAQVAPQQVVYIDNRKMCVEVARSLGMHCLHHSQEATTRTRLIEFGFIPSPVTIYA